MTDDVLDTMPIQSAIDFWEAAGCPDFAQLLRERLKEATEANGE